MLLVFKIKQTKSELDLYTLPGPVNTTLFLSESCDIIADSVALVLNNYSLNMNRESSVVQLKDHNESSNIIVVSTSFSSEISPVLSFNSTKCFSSVQICSISLLVPFIERNI